MHEEVLSRIEEEILQGRLRVGDRLLGERDLAQALGVSRSSVREALRVLEAMGVIEARVGSGADAGSVVSARTTPALGNLIRLHMALAAFDLADLVETRVQLERWAVARAAGREDQGFIAELDQLVKSMREPDLTIIGFTDLDTEFHVVLAQSSGNPLLSEMMQALRDAVRINMIAAFERFDDWRPLVKKLVAEHQRVVRAIETHDAARAADTVDRHIQGFYRKVGPPVAGESVRAVLAQPGRLVGVDRPISRA